MPEGKPGTALTFKALQTYDNGDIVRWIGAPDADTPAPQVTLTAADRQRRDDAGGEHVVRDAGRRRPGRFVVG